MPDLARILCPAGRSAGAAGTRILSRPYRGSSDLRHSGKRDAAAGEILSALRFSWPVPQSQSIGSELGGFFTLRFASENPDCVACIYLDAPLCNMADGSTSALAEAKQTLSEAYHLRDEEMLLSPLNPINSLRPIAEAGVPIFAVTGEDDLVVPVQQHINIIEERFRNLGGKITLCRRKSWGHHPHGLDDRSELLAFMVENAGKYCAPKY